MYYDQFMSLVAGHKPGEPMVIYGCLDLKRCTGLTKLPDNLTVGGFLDLSGTGITSLPDNLTVGGFLNLRGTGITSLPDSLVVGGTILFNVGAAIGKIHVTKLKNGDYVEGRYLYADGMLTHIERKKAVGEYTLYIGKIKGKNVVSDGTYYAHCGSIREGIEDIAFKRAKDRGADQYRELPLDTRLTPEEAKTMYRIITGACRAGTEGFVISLGKIKEHYTIEEIIQMTKGQYGGTIFRDFFAERM